MLKKDNLLEISISTNTFVRGFLVLLGFFLIWYLQELVLVVLTSIVIASFVESAVPYFKKIGMGRLSGVVSFYLISGLIFSFLFYLFAPLLITEIYNFSGFLYVHFPDVPYLDYFQSEEFGGAKELVASLSGKLSLSSLVAISNTFVGNLSGGFIQTLAIAFGGIFNFILIIIISFYLSVQERGIENFLRIILPLKYEDYVIDLWSRSRRKIALWLKGQMFLALIISVLIYLLLALIGIDYALLLALIAGFMSFLPYGSVIALIPAMSFSYLGGGIQDALMVAGVYIIIHQFEVFLFSPLIINRVVGLSPLMVIIAVLVGFELSGIWGMILAIPVAVFFMELMNDMEKEKNILRSKENNHETN
ncbi:MAG: AI-2E family transporter [Candidatus Paceibacterota bacterium]